MLNWLLRMWRGFAAWLVGRPVETPHLPDAKPYFPSNLHARNR